MTDMIVVVVVVDDEHGNDIGSKGIPS